MINEPQQHTYLLRLWHSDDGSLRILLQKPADDKPEGFTTIEDLSHHLKALLGSDADNDVDADALVEHRRLPNER